MIKIEFNAAPIFRRLEQATALLSNLTPVHEDITEYMIEATKARFRLGVGPDGKNWAPKKPATIARYKAKGYGDRPDPLIGPSKSLSRDVIGQSSKTASEVGSALEYSGVMQGGARKGAFGSYGPTPLPWGDIPARVWLGISTDDERNILDIVDEHLAEAVDG